MKSTCKNKSILYNIIMNITKVGNSIARYARLKSYIGVIILNVLLSNGIIFRISEMIFGRLKKSRRCKQSNLSSALNVKKVLRFSSSFLILLNILRYKLDIFKWFNKYLNVHFLIATSTSPVPVNTTGRPAAANSMARLSRQCNRGISSKWHLISNDEFFNVCGPIVSRVDCCCDEGCPRWCTHLKFGCNLCFCTFLHSCVNFSTGVSSK